MPFRLSWILAIAFSARAQVVVQGRIINSTSGVPLTGAMIQARSVGTGLTSTARSNRSGRFVLRGSRSGAYSLRVSATGFQEQQLAGVSLSNGSNTLDFRLRPISDVWEAQELNTIVMPGTEQIVRFYGPDVDISRVVSVAGPAAKLRPQAAEKERFEPPARRAPLTTVTIPPPSIRAEPAAIHQLDQAIADNRILPDQPDGGFSVLAKLKETLPPEAYRAEEVNLRTALEDRGQQVLLRYLAGDEVPQTRSDYQLGAELYSAAERLEPGDRLIQERTLFFQARVATLDRQYQQAEMLLKKALALDPDAAYIHNARGIELLEQRNVNEATNEFRFASFLSPHWAYPLHNLAVAQIVSGDLVAAVDSYHSAMELAPDRAYLPYNLGLLYQKMGRFEEAGLAYRRAIEIAQPNAAMYNALGTLYSSTGKTRNAEVAFREALTIDPAYLPARQNLALLYSKLKDGQAEAITLLHQNLQQDPAFMPAMLLLASTLANTGDNAGALSTYRNVLQILPENVAVRIAIAQLELKSGMAEDAVAQLMAAIQVDPANLGTYEMLGDAKLVLNKPTDARDAYERALQAAQSSADKNRLRNKLRMLP